MFRSTLLIMAAMWAGTAPTKSIWLKSYFAAHVIYNLLSMATHFDIRSSAYLALFAARTFLWLTAGAAYTFECFLKHSRGLRVIIIVEATMLPLFITGVSFTKLRPYFPEMSNSIFMALGMGCALTAISVGMGTVGLTTPNHFRARILALFWTCYAAWSYAFAYGQPLAENLFLQLNKWLPAAIVIFWFTVFGFVARVNEEV